MIKAKIYDPVVFAGRENTVLISLDDYDAVNLKSVPFAWTDFTRVVVNLISIDDATLLADEVIATADTDVLAAYADYSTAGKLVLKLGALLTLAAAAITPGEYMIRVTGYKTADPHELIHESSSLARLTWSNAGSTL